MQDDGAQPAAETVCRLLCGVFDCPVDLANHILGRGRLRQFEGRTTIVRRGDRISALYVIITGRAHAIVYSLDGQIVLLHEFRSGDFFGVVSPPYSTIHDADVLAVEEVFSFLLEGNVLALLAEQHGCIGLALLKAKCRRKTDCVSDFKMEWCPGTELNRRHRDFQSRALPTELPGLIRRMRKRGL